MNALEEENATLRRILLAVAGCTNCKVCREMALKTVGSPWEARD